MMEELITRIVTNVGLDEETAHAAVRVVLSFLYQHGDREKVAALVGAIPGAAEYVREAEDNSSGILGGLGGLMGGGAMEVLGKLQGLGLGMGQIQGVAQETIDFARQKAGTDVVDDVIASVPGLSQFV
jgi:hypothetical protein